MKKEFKLSDKIIDTQIRFEKDLEEGCAQFKSIKVKDVKEFIRLLNELILNGKWGDEKDLVLQIDELAGDLK